MCARHQHERIRQSYGFRRRKLTAARLRRLQPSHICHRGNARTAARLRRLQPSHIYHKGNAENTDKRKARMAYAMRAREDCGQEKTRPAMGPAGLRY